MSKIENTAHLPNPADFEQETLHFLKSFNFDGVKPSLAHITAIARHFSRLPYENISKILKHSQHQQENMFRLPDELIADHFEWHAGGTCFSLTYFLMGIFELLGYRAQPLICDLNWGSNNHSAVLLTFSGMNYLIDPGYMIFKPLPFTGENIQSQISSDTGISLQFQAEVDKYALYTFRKNQYTRRYQFSPKPISLNKFADYWNISFELPGMDDLILTQVSGYEMLYIQGDFVKITSPQQIQKFREADRAESLIQSQFKIPMEKVEEARHILQQRKIQNES